MFYLRLKQGLICFFTLLSLNSYALPGIKFTTFDCDEVIRNQASPIRAAYEEAYSKGYISSSHQCLLKSADQVDDIGDLLNGIPENTVVMIVQSHNTDHKLPESQAFSYSLMPDQRPARDVVPHRLYTHDHRRSLNVERVRISLNVDHAVPEPSTIVGFRQNTLSETTRCIPSKTYAHLKKGTVLLGINEALGGGGIPLCEAEKPERIWMMFEVGNNDIFEDVGKIYVSGFNFYPLLDNEPNPVDSIWRIRCYTGNIHFESNYFRLDSRASVYLQCVHNTQDKVFFSFHGNTVIGMGSARSNEGLLVDLRNLENDREAASLDGNWFGGNIKSAIEVRLDNGSSMRIKNNHVRPALSEFREVNIGLELHGSREDGKEPKVIVKNNFLQTDQASLRLYGRLNIKVTDNQMQSSELLEILTRTDEGYYSTPDITLKSPEANDWYGSSDCPQINDTSSLHGHLSLLVKPGRRRCEFDFK